jgi:hypothetical protein
VESVRQSGHLVRHLDEMFMDSLQTATALPKPAHPGAKKALVEIWGAEDKDHALAAVKAFEAAYAAKFPKAVAKITDDEAAQASWSSVNAPHQVALVRAGARFEGGKLVERVQENAA